MSTRRLIAFSIAALPFIAGCQDGKETRQLRQEIGVLKTDAAAASKRIAALERELDEARQQQAADNRILAMFVGRVQRVEAVLGERLYAAETNTRIPEGLRIYQKALADVAAMDQTERKPERSLPALPQIESTPRPVPARSVASVVPTEEVCVGCNHDPASLGRPDGRMANDRVYINPKTKLYHRPGCVYIGPHMQLGGSYDFERMRGYKPDPECSG